MNNKRKSEDSLAWPCFRYTVVLLPFFTLLSGIGLIIGVVLSWKKDYSSLLRYPPNWGLALFSTWLLITSAFSFNPGQAYLGAFNILPFVLFLSSSGVFIQKPAQLRHLAWLIVLPSFPIVILGLLQLFQGWESSKLINDLNLGWTLIAYGEPHGRMSSIFMYANTFAAYLLMAFILGAGLWLDTYLFWREKLNQRGKILFILLTLTIITDVVGLILTDSRNAWILLIVAILAFAFYLGYRWLVIGITSLAGVIAAASWAPSPISNILRKIVPEYFWARLSDELYPNRSIGSLRTTQWNFAWDMMLQHPILGAGLRSFSPLYEAKVGEWFGHPHNLFLMLLAEIGIPGTLILCGVITWVLIKQIELLNMGINYFKVSNNPAVQSDNLIIVTYLIAFGSCVLFNCLDVSLFNIKVNIFGWIVLAGIWGTVYHQFQIKDKIKAKR